MPKRKDYVKYYISLQVRELEFIISSGNKETIYESNRHNAIKSVLGQSLSGVNPKGNRRKLLEGRA